jgi:hypothetical protein
MGNRCNAAGEDMDEHRQIEDMTEAFLASQQDYWRLGDREKPRLLIALTAFLLLGTPFAFAVLFRTHPQLAFLSAAASMLVVCVLSYRVMHYYSHRSRLARQVIGLKDSIVAVNARQFQGLLDQVPASFEGEKRDFAEFFIWMLAFFGFVWPRKERGSTDVPFVNRWRFPPDMGAEAYAEAVLNSPALQGLPAGQKAGILAVVRRNALRFAGKSGDGCADGPDFEQPVYLLLDLLKKKKTGKRLTELFDSFII